VNSDLQDRRSRIKRTIDCANAAAVPAATEQIGAAATVPGCCVNRLIKPPSDDWSPGPERRRKRRQV
jgi:hypothetical protein